MVWLLYNHRWLRHDHWLLYNHRWLSLGHYLILYNSLFHSNNRLDHWLLNWGYYLAVVVENNFTQLDASHFAAVVQFKSHHSRLTRQLWEINQNVWFHDREIKLSVCDLGPAASNWMPRENFDVCRRCSWLVTRTSETNTVEGKVFCEFNLDPGSVVVWSLPLVPWFLAWAQQVLRLALFTSEDHVVLGGDLCRGMQEISLSYGGRNCLGDIVLAFVSEFAKKSASSTGTSATTDIDRVVVAKLDGDATLGDVDVKFLLSLSRLFNCDDRLFDDDCWLLHHWLLLLRQDYSWLGLRHHRLLSLYNLLRHWLSLAHLSCHRIIARLRHTTWNRLAASR